MKTCKVCRVEDHGHEECPLIHDVIVFNLSKSFGEQSAYEQSRTIEQARVLRNVREYTGRNSLRAKEWAGMEEED